MAYSVIGNHYIPFSDRPTKQQLEQLQIHKLNQMLTFLLQYNRFYQKKVRGDQTAFAVKSGFKTVTLYHQEGIG